MEQPVYENAAVMDYFVSDEKIGELFGITEGQIRGYKDRNWTRDREFALIAGRIMYNPAAIVRWQHSQVSVPTEAESKSDGSTRASPTLSSSTRPPRQGTSRARLDNVKSSLNSVN